MKRRPRYLTKAKKFKSQININWTNVLQELRTIKWEEVEPGRKERQVYLGSCLNLTPSGKYYTPFACSNVEVCRACAEASDGPCDETSPCTGSTGDPLTGEGHCEVCRDAAWQKQLESEAEEFGLYVTSGEGNACDIMVGEWK